MRIVGATLPAARPEEAAAFYAEALRLDVPLRFVEGPPAVHHFAFHASDLAAARARVEAHVRLLGDGREFDFTAWEGARAVYFHDAAGNVVELIERPEPRPEWTLAEVGLPVEDVAAAIRALALPLYREASDTFAPVGDADGLLIVVAAGRGWFPTDEPASLAPLRVEVDALTREVRVGPHMVVGLG